VSLLITELALDFKTYDKVGKGAFEQPLFDMSDDLLIPDTKFEIEIPKTQTPVAPNPILEKIEIIDNDNLDAKETVIETTEMDIDEAVVLQDISYDKILEEEIEEEVVEDVPFFVIEKVPVFPGCTGTNEALRKCLQEAIQTHVSKNFNVDLAQDLGLTSGEKRIFVMFVIDKEGKITGVRSRAPHKRLQIESERVVKSLPTMIPGKQRGRPVGVKYSLPIVFKIE